MAQIAEQSPVLDGDDRLGGEVRDQRDLLVVEWTNFLAKNRDGTNQRTFFQHRHVEDAPIAP